ncbi:HutD family protein [Paraburkholderia mimosarum]|uniref:HutD family protein n=1 Tax=Paraburkholderia mimosarum TaxID=312026 RepID=UPI0012DD8CC5|nr:HutD family protein [Paraburkholderia mimosarum]
MPPPLAHGSGATPLQSMNRTAALAVAASKTRRSTGCADCRAAPTTRSVTSDIAPKSPSASCRRAPGQPVHFSGDLYMWANAPGQPVSVLNVMCRRGVARARVNVASHSLRVTPAATQLLVSLAGQWSVESSLLRGVTLAPLHVLWISGRSEELALRPSAPGAQLASVAIDLLDEDASRP